MAWSRLGAPIGREQTRVGLQVRKVKSVAGPGDCVINPYAFSVWFGLSHPYLRKRCGAASFATEKRSRKNG